jgi:neutral ceramidase
MKRTALMGLALLVGACGGGVSEVAPAVPSLPPEAGGGALRAGVGRRDITPPPGPGLAGGGPEGRPAQGWRSRLHARALVLEDRRGEAIVLVVADLPFVSILLHRRVAELIRAETPIGADRLIISATHTHSGPGHFLDAESYNRQGSSVPGYDRALLEFLARRISAAVVVAWNTRATARLAWGESGVSGVTRSRSTAAGRSAPDTTLLMLRVDVRRGSDTAFAPAAALSLFAIHGTGNSPENDLWDADIQGRVMQQLEVRVPGTVHLFANGAEGDVSPVWADESRCIPPALRRTRLSGSRSPRSWEWVGQPEAKRRRCVAVAIAGMDSISRTIADRAGALFLSLRPGPPSEQTLVTRAFVAQPLRGDHALPGLCPEAEPGAATVAGAEDLPTRYRGWRFLGVIPSAFEEGGRAARAPRGCQAEKRPALGSVLRRLTGVGRGFPESAQLSVVRIGGHLLAAVPLEATSAAGALFARHVAAAADSAGAPADRVAVVGLANGFAQYVATREEYRAQQYEGASTIYGPGTAEAFAEALAALTRELGPPGTPSPAALVDSIVVEPGAARRVMPVPGETSHIARRITRLTCGADGLMGEWEDARPGALDPSAQLLLRIERLDPGGARLVAEDDGAVEVRSLGPTGGGAWRWRAMWPDGTPGRYRLVLAARPGVAELSATCVTAEPASPPLRQRTR